MTCDAGDFDSIDGLLGGVDCRVATYVEQAYRGLYGPFGWLGPVLTAALTIYVALFAYQLIIGAGRLTVTGLTRRFIAVGVVVALSSNWAAYQTAAANLMSGGGEEVAEKLLQSTGGGGAADVGARLDSLFGDIADLATNWNRRAPLQAAASPSPSGPSDAPPPPLAQQPAIPTLDAVTAVNMLWMSALILGLGSAGVIVVAKVILGFLLALGPLFIMLALFPQTRGLFEGWLRTTAANALIPLFAIAAAAAMIPVVEPIVSTVADAQARGVVDIKPVFTLTLAALIFGILMIQTVFMTTKLAGAWRLPAPHAEKERTGEGAAGVAAAATPGGVDPRIIALVAATGRDAASGSSAEARRSPGALALYAPPQGQFSAEGGGRRVAAGYRGFGAGRSPKGRPA